MAVVICAACNGKMKAPDEAAGKKVRCPRCKAAVAVPSGEEPQEEAAPEQDVPEMPTVVRRVVAQHVPDRDESPAPRRRDDDRYQDPLPRRRRKSRSSGGSSAGCGVAAVVLVVLAVLFVVGGVAGVVGLYWFGGMQGLAGTLGDRVRKGMTEQEVEAVLGPPVMSMNLDGFAPFLAAELPVRRLDGSMKTVKVSIWGDETEVVEVYFLDGRAEKITRERNQGVGAGAGGTTTWTAGFAIKWTATAACARIAAGGADGGGRDEGRTGVPASDLRETGRRRAAPHLCRLAGGTR